MTPPLSARNRLLLAALLLGVITVGLALAFWPSPSLQLAGVEVRTDGGRNTDLLLRGAGFRGKHATLLPEIEPHFTSAEVTPPVPVYHLSIDGDLAVAVTRGGRLITIGVRAGESPSILGSLVLEHGINSATREVLVLERKAVVAFNHGAIALVDVGNPATPRLVDWLEVPLQIGQMVALNGRIYATDLKGSLNLLTIEGNRLRHRTLDRSASCWRLAVSGHLLVTGSLQGDLFFYEMTAEGSVRRVGSRRLPQGVRGLAFSGAALYVSLADGLLEEYSLLPWPQLQPTGRLQLPGRPLFLTGAEGRPVIYCSLVGVGVGGIDTSRPGDPRLSTWMPLRRSPTAIAVASGRLIAGSVDGLRILALDQLPSFATMPVVFSFREKFSYKGLLSWGQGVIAHTREEVRVLANGLPAPAPQQPYLPVPVTAGIGLFPFTAESGVATRPVATLSLPAPAIDGFWHGDLLVVLEPLSLRLFRSDGRGNYLPVGRFPLSARAVGMGWLDPGYVVMQLQGEGLLVVDVSVPAEPRLAGTLPMPKYMRGIGTALSMVVDGQRAFVARGRVGVVVVDLSNPAVPRREQIIATPGVASQLALQDGIVTVADRDAGLFFIDVRGGNCLPLGSQPLFSIPQKLAVSNLDLFVLNSGGEVLRVPAPRRLGKVEPGPGDTARVALPAGISPGSYRLVVYDEAGRASLPVTIP